MILGPNAHRKASVLIGTRNRSEPLLRCLESVLAQDYPNLEVLILDDGSDRLYVRELLNSHFTDSRIRLFRNEIASGVSGGRNFLMQQATGDFVFIIDDDAHFQTPQELSRVAKILEVHPGVGILAVKIIDHPPGQPHSRILAPFSQSTRRADPGVLDRPGRVSYYLGGGHAITRAALEKLKGYQGSFTYGEEELDLSYRAIEQGYDLLYDPSVVIEHHPETSVLVQGSRQEIHYHTRNRLLLAWKYIPIPQAIFYVLVWTGRNLVRAIRRGAILQFLTGASRALRDAGDSKRTPMSASSLAYLRKNHGRIWY